MVVEITEGSLSIFTPRTHHFPTGSSSFSSLDFKTPRSTEEGEMGGWVGLTGGFIYLFGCGELSVLASLLFFALEHEP